MRARPGFVFLDALWGIGLLTMLAAVLLITVHAERQAQQRLIDTGAASRLAESALTLMQGGNASNQAVKPGSKISVHTLSTPTELPGKSWVRVNAIVNKRNADVIGLVPTGAIPTTAPSGGTP